MGVRVRLREFAGRHPWTLQFLAMVIVLALLSYGMVSYVNHRDNVEQAQLRDAETQRARNEHRRDLARERALTEAARERLRKALNRVARTQCLASRAPGSPLSQFNELLKDMGRPQIALPTVAQCRVPLIPADRPEEE